MNVNNFQETQLGFLPKNWQVVKLGDIADYINGYAFKPEQWETKGRPIIRIQNLTGSSDTVNYFSGDLDNRYFVINGDLLISWSASLDAFIWNRGEAWLNQHIFKVDNIHQNCDKGYLYFALKHIIGSIRAKTRGSTMKHITRKEFVATPVALPPLPEQRAIARVLSTVRQAIDATEGVIADARELKRSMMKHLFTYGPVPVDKADQVILQETEFGEVPTDWQIIPIKDMGEVITGSTPSTKEQKYYGGKYKLISPANLNENPYVDSAHRWLTEEGLEQSRVLPKGTVLVSCIGYIGKTGITKDEKSATNQQINAVVCNDDTNPKFAYYALTNLQKYLENRARITTVPILTKTNFQNLKIARPSYEIQLEIANKLDAIIRKIEYETDVKTALEKLFDSLLHHLMTGKVRVPYEQ